MNLKMYFVFELKSRKATYLIWLSISSQNVYLDPTLNVFLM